MKILVMGGTGFVSSSLVKYLISKGHNVDIFTRGKRKLEYSGISTQHIGDRSCIEDLNNSIKNIEYDYVFDISAYNLLDVENLFKALNRKKLKRYIFCSSGAVYEPSETIINEEFKTGDNANWKDYGLNKLKAEKYLIDLNKNENVPIVIFRPTYIYGPYNDLYRESYVFDRLHSGRDIPIPAGNTKVQFIYIDDLIKVFESSMYEKKVVGQVYNVTNPEIITWSQYVNLAMAVTKKDVNIRYIYESAAVNTREYFPFRNCTYLLDISKLKKDNLYIPKINLLEGLGISYKWYLEKQPKLEDKRMNKIEYVLNLV